MRTDLTYDTATGAGFGIAASRGLAGGRRGYKAALFEGGIGVPFIARWPGKIAAGKIDQTSLMSAVDLLPTFCELVAARLPEDYRPDGVSQVDTLLGAQHSTRSKPLFWKIDAAWPIPKSRPYHWVSYAVIHEHWKLLTNHDATYSELYDLVADLYEKRDLKEQEPAVVRQLLQQLEQWQATLPQKPSERTKATS